MKILNRWTDACLLGSKKKTIKEALEEAVRSSANLSSANLSGADLYGANLYSANLSRADLSSADLYGANLTSADLSGADLSGANLYSANLSGANLSGADLYGANLYGANLSSANLYGAILTSANVNSLRTSPLYMLRDQPGNIRLYKLVNADGVGPFSGGIKYEIGKTYKVNNASTNENKLCAAGINVATLDWCLREFKDGYRVLVVEFKAKDIACIPLGTNGKIRLHSCKVVGEKSLKQLGLIQETKERAKAEKRAAKGAAA